MVIRRVGDRFVLRGLSLVGRGEFCGLLRVLDNSPWLAGFEVDADTVLELKHNHNVVRVVKDTDAVITLPSFKHSTPVAFQLVVAQGCKNMTLKLPEGGAWSSASWSAYGQLEKDGLVLGAVACDEGVVISVRSRALCEDGKFIYVLQCRRV